MISIIVPTFRMGGLDVLYHGLVNQTYKDFQLILIDMVYKYRQQKVRELINISPFPILHMEPYDNPFPTVAYQRCVNTGISEAAGNLVLFLGDYTWLPPDCVEKHIVFHEKNPKSVHVCPMQHLKCPELDYTFIPYHNISIEGVYQTILPRPENARLIDNYVADLESGSLEKFGISIFKEPFKGIDNFELCSIMPGADSALRESAGPCRPDHFHFQNDSVSQEMLLSINGADETFDGTNGWQDMEVAERLVQEGATIILDPLNVAYYINPKFIFPRCNWLRPANMNQSLYHLRRSQGYPKPNSWSLQNGWGSMIVS